MRETDALGRNESNSRHERLKVFFFAENSACHPADTLSYHWLMIALDDTLDRASRIHWYRSCVEGGLKATVR